ncbi:glycosyltransferase family A protein [Sphaerisporangium perillae]|uniref:glycosyltransferase family A protein n=1 Tax=Sphaerisporangium perillae TaxID=2935860 RepID=UPI00200CA467|nr:glycosyltransferase family A protein [Sphaerisporangium perillae]
MSEELESTRQALEAAVAAAAGAAELTRLLADYQERLARAATSEAEALTRLREAEARLKAAEKQVTQLAKNLAEQRYQAEAAQWRLESVQASRWSKLGDAIHTKNPGEVARTLRAPISKRPAPKRSDFSPAPPALDVAPVPPVVPATAGPAVSTAMAEGFVVPKGPLTRPYLTVAAIVDRQSEALFRYEWRQVTNFGPGNWQAMLDQHRPHLLFVESVQPGPRQGNGGRWLEELAGRSRGLRDLVEECARRGIRTIFWHSGGPLSASVPMATLFDQVLATSEARAREWRAALRHDRVGVLPHAVQPRVHNQIRAAEGRSGVGLLGTALQGDLPPDAGWRPLITDKATYDDLLTTYRAVSMVLAGPDADARTVEELSACGTPIMQLTTPVDQASLPQALDSVRENLAAEIECASEAHLAWRATAPVTPLLDPILDTAGVPSVRNAATVTAVTAVSGPAELDHLLTQLRRQSHTPGQLVIVADGLDAAVVEKAARGALAGRGSSHAEGDLVIREAGTPMTRGAALDRALRLADGDLVAVLDPRDLYGEHYLADLTRYFTAVDADIIGKASFYAHITGTGGGASTGTGTGGTGTSTGTRTGGGAGAGATLLRQPGADHRFLPEVAGGTLLARRQALVELGIADVSEEWDEVLMRQCRTDGIRVYSADRYSYVCVRPSTEGRLLTSAHFEGYVQPHPLAMI